MDVIAIVTWALMALSGLLIAIGMGIDYMVMDVPDGIYKGKFGITLFGEDMGNGNEARATQAFVCLGLVALIMASLSNIISLVKNDMQKMVRLIQGVILLSAAGSWFLAIIIFGAHFHKNWKSLNDIIIPDTADITL